MHSFFFSFFQNLNSSVSDVTLLKEKGKKSKEGGKYVIFSLVIWILLLIFFQYRRKNNYSKSNIFFSNLFVLYNRKKGGIQKKQKQKLQINKNINIFWTNKNNIHCDCCLKKMVNTHSINHTPIHSNYCDWFFFFRWCVYFNYSLPFIFII